MVQILSTLIPADAGEAFVGGHDLARDPNGVRSVIGVTGQFSAVDDLLTGKENLMLVAKLRHLSRRERERRVPELLERFELVDAADKTPATYSGGMRRRLDLAMTLLGSPRIIFLDEPTTGLDPRSRHVMWDIVRSLVADGVTIFLTTQYLDEADELPIGSRCWIGAGSWPKAHRPSSSGASPADMCGCSSPTGPRSTRRPPGCRRRRGTTRR